MLNRFKFISFVFISLVSFYLIYNYFQSKNIKFTYFESYDFTGSESYANNIDNISNLAPSEFVSSLNGDKSDILLSINIPKINVYNDVYRFDSDNNNINKNVLILAESDMPDVPFGNLILGAHSGSGRLAYFKDLDKLSLGDDIIVYYNGKAYLYKVVNFYVDLKDGSIEIVRNYEKDSITLYTCMPSDKDSFLIVVGEKLSEY